MKFLSWFLGIILLLSSVSIFGFFNFHQLFFSPTSFKTALVKIDFYNQAESVIKKDVFESTGSTSSTQIALSKAISQVLDSYNFQPKIEKLIDDFFTSISIGGHNQVLSVDLVPIKNQLAQTFAAQTNSSADISSELTIPDSWQINLSSYSSSLSIASFFYRNSLWIYLGFILLYIMFFFTCFSVGAKYLKVFFSFSLVIGILLFFQFLFLQFVNLGAIFSSITEQGRSGLTLIVGNLLDYIRSAGSHLVLWESLPIILVSIVGSIIVGITTKEKVGKIPLNEK
ncbi:MAG: hypothetical protein NTW79_04155 [Candidatus Berkelbacteria bacterium]|nr:hypothetical protein [Candidatus Berkelbacteria bacterium]